MNKKLIIIISLALISGLVIVLSAGSKEKDHFILGVQPEQNIVKQIERYRALKEYLTKGLGKEVEIRPLKNYAIVYDELKKGHIQGAVFGSLMYLITESRVEIEPLVRPEVGGVSTYKALMFARKDSRIIDYKDMKGKSIALVDRATADSSIFPLAYFRSNGIKDMNVYLGRQIFTGSHDSSILFVLNRKAEVGVAKDTIYKKLADENPRINKELNVIASQKGSNPNNTLAVVAGLPYRDKLKELFLDMDKNPQGQAVLRALGVDRYITTTNKDFDDLKEMIRSVGINLQQYDFYVGR